MHSLVMGSPPTRGAWIETFQYIDVAGTPQSPPTRGAWIETLENGETLAIER